MRYTRPLSLLVISALALGSQGCTTILPDVFPPKGDLTRILDERGPMVLSPTNPYLAANQVVAQEIGRSATVRGFIEQRGTPSAVSVERDFLGNVTYQYFYPEEAEYFFVERKRGTYAIQGPIKLPGKLMASITRAMSAREGDPLLATALTNGEPSTGVYGKVDRNEANSHTAALNNDSFDQGVETTDLLESSPNSGTGTLDSIYANDNAQDSLNSGSSQYAQSREEVLLKRLYSRPEQEIAERTPAGDLVHYVTSEDETLELIALWYTGKEANNGEVAEVNERSVGDTLELGDTVVIPYQLVHHDFMLDDEARAALVGGETPTANYY